MSRFGDHGQFLVERASKKVRPAAVLRVRGVPVSTSINILGLRVTGRFLRARALSLETMPIAVPWAEARLDTLAFVVR